MYLEAAFFGQTNKQQQINIFGKYLLNEILYDLINFVFNK